jgi:hypothetical protein
MIQVDFEEVLLQKKWVKKNFLFLFSPIGIIFRNYVSCFSAISKAVALMFVLEGLIA